MQQRLYCWLTTFAGFDGILVSLPLGRAREGLLYFNNVSFAFFVKQTEKLRFLLKKVWEKFGGYL